MPYQVVGSAGYVNKENPEISDIGPQFGAPGDFAFQNHLVGVNVVEVRTLRQQEHPFFREESFFLVENALFQDKMAFDESMVLVVLGLIFQSDQTSMFGYEEH